MFSVTSIVTLLHHKLLKTLNKVTLARARAILSLYYPISSNILLRRRIKEKYIFTSISISRGGIVKGRGLEQCELIAPHGRDKFWLGKSELNSPCYCFFVAVKFQSIEVIINGIPGAFSGIAGPADNSQIGASRRSVWEYLIKGEVIKIVVEWFIAGITFTTIIVEKPSIPEKHFNIVNSNSVFVAKLLGAHALFPGMSCNSRSCLWSEGVGVPFLLAFPHFAFFTDSFPSRFLGYIPLPQTLTLLTEKANRMLYPASGTCLSFLLFHFLHLPIKKAHWLLPPACPQQIILFFLIITQ